MIPLRSVSSFTLLPRTLVNAYAVQYNISHEAHDAFALTGLPGVLQGMQCEMRCLQ